MSAGLEESKKKEGERGMSDKHEGWRERSGSLKMLENEGDGGIEAWRLRKPARGKGNTL